MIRGVVAALFVASVLAAAVVGGSDEPSVPVAAVTSTVVPSTTTTAPLPPTTEAPPPPSTTTTAVTSAAAKVVVSATGVVLPVVGRDGDAYRVSTPCGATTTVRGATPVAAAAVVLDPGHGGSEPGAVGPNGLSEKVLNLAVAQHAKAALEREGFAVALTRTADHRIPLEARAKIVTALAPKAFVSIHHNAEPDGPRPTGPGSETYYQVASAESKRLAGLVYEEVVRALSAYQVPWVADTDAGAKYRTNDKGDDYYGILRRTQGVPASLAELAFVSNPPEAELLARADVQQVEGEAVARGIVRYLTTRDPGSGFTTPYPRTTPAGPGGGTRNCVDPPL